MPSFARANNPSADPLGALEDIWKNKEVDIVAELMRDSRLRAATILRSEIPAKMQALRELIKSTNDESSPFWKGHVHQGEYLKPTMLFHDASSGSTLPATAASKVLGSAADGLTGGVAKVSLVSHSEHPFGDVKSERPSIPSPIVLPEDVAAVYPASKAPASASAAMAEAQSEVEAKGAQVEAGQAGQVAGVSTSTEALAERKITMGGHWFEVVPRNKVQSQCIEIALREFEAMYDLVNELKLWLEMEIPQIEDGNSFGTEIQQHLINQLLNANKAIVAWENAVRQHYSDRAKYVSEWVKTPNCEDWALTIASSDRFDHHLIRGYLSRALTVYAGLLTKFERNWEKVVFPKGRQGPASVGMY